MFISVSEFARHRRVSAASVSQAITDGRIKREPDGSIEVTQANLDWERNTRKARRDPRVDAQAGLKRRATWAKKLAARAQVVAANATPQPGTHEGVRHADRGPEPVADYGKLETNSLSYADARAYKENLAARLAEIELEQRQRSVLPRELVAQSLETLFRAHRDGVLNIANRIAALAFEQTSVAGVHAVLDEELRKSLDELSDGLATLAERTVKAA